MTEPIVNVLTRSDAWSIRIDGRTRFKGTAKTAVTHLAWAMQDLERARDLLTRARPHIDCADLLADIDRFIAPRKRTAAGKPTEGTNPRSRREHP